MYVWEYVNSSDGIDTRFFSSKKKALKACNDFLEINEIPSVCGDFQDHYFQDFPNLSFWIRLRRIKLE